VARDYEVLGVPFARRGARMDEAVDIVRRLSAGGYVEHHGEAYDFPALKIARYRASPCRS